MTYNELHKKAADLANLGKHKEAVEVYRKASLKKWENFEALQGWAGSLTWLDRFREALQLQITSAACFPDRTPDYFVLKTRIKTNIINNDNKHLLKYTIECLYVLVRILKFNFFANDFLAEMLLLNGKEKEAKERKYFASICHAAFSKRQNLDIFNRSEGALPDFFVIGPQKTATTALYSFLTKSKDVYPSINKELFFFNGPSYAHGLEWYKCHFPNASANKRIVTGEATATYFNSSPKVAERISQYVPQAKLIFTFRNPSKRAISSFYMEKRHGRELGSLTDVILSEIDFIRNNKLEEGGHPKGYFDSGHKGYVLYGFYNHYLSNFKSYFGNDQILIILSEELREPQPVVDKISNFIGIESPNLDISKQVNVGEYDKDGEYYIVLDQLNKFYKEYSEYVGEFIDI